jgi:hypothetical protein
MPPSGTPKNPTQPISSRELDRSNAQSVNGWVPVSRMP